MSTSTNRRFTKAVPALLLTLAVLVVGLAGTATAAKLITGKQIKNSTITHKDVKDGSLKEADLNKLAKAKLNAPSVKGYQVVTVTEQVESGGQHTVHVACPAGKVVLSGGGKYANTENDTQIVSSLPQKVIRGDALFFTDPEPGFADGWAVEAKHNLMDPQNLTAYAICVSPN